jgi:hypothetical protein
MTQEQINARAAYERCDRRKKRDEEIGEEIGQIDLSDYSHDSGGGSFE